MTNIDHDYAERIARNTSQMLSAAHTRVLNGYGAILRAIGHCNDCDLQENAVLDAERELSQALEFVRAVRESKKKSSIDHEWADALAQVFLAAEFDGRRNLARAYLDMRAHEARLARDVVLQQTMFEAAQKQVNRLTAENKAGAELIVSLRARNERLREALAPFVKAAPSDPAWHDDIPISSKWGPTATYSPTVGDLRRARQAYEEGGR